MALVILHGLHFANSRWHSEAEAHKRNVIVWIGWERQSIVGAAEKINLDSSFSNWLPSTSSRASTKIASVLTRIRDERRRWTDRVAMLSSCRQRTNERANAANENDTHTRPHTGAHKICAENKSKSVVWCCQLPSCRVTSHRIASQFIHHTHRCRAWRAQSLSRDACRILFSLFWFSMALRVWLEKLLDLFARNRDDDDECERPFLVRCQWNYKKQTDDDRSFSAFGCCAYAFDSSGGERRIYFV